MGTLTPATVLDTRLRAIGGSAGAVRRVEMTVFVGERYIPRADQETAFAQAELLRVAVLRRAPGDSPVRLISTTFVPNEEWAFDVFEADLADQVRRLYADSGLSVERVTEVVHLAGPDDTELS